jgi:hypothetical protein
MLVKLLMNVKPIMKCWLSYWITLANSIRDEWLGYD